MGPTGSGKTSLLNVLSMRTGLSRGSHYKGLIQVDGVELKNRNEFSRVGSFVQQDDILPE